RGTAPAVLSSAERDLCAPLPMQPVLSVRQALRAPDREGATRLVAIGPREVDVPGQLLPALLRAGDVRRLYEVIGAEVGTGGEDVAEVGGRGVVLVEGADTHDQIDGLEDRRQADVALGDVLTLHPGRDGHEDRPVA